MDRPEPDLTAPTYRDLGVGARFSLYPMTGGYVDVILGALDSVDTAGLEISTDDISTYVAGSERDLLRYLRDVIVAAEANQPGVHLGTSILLSRGCPGEVRCELNPEAGLPRAEPVHLEAAGLDAAAHWSLYPLGVGRHLDSIERAVEAAKEAGTYAGSEHYVTRLEGDLARVLETAANGWLEVGSEVAHVVAHVSLSINSPTPSNLRGGTDE